MAALYITSTSEAAGKSTLAAGLSNSFRSKGKKVGYFKSICGSAEGEDRDVGLMKELLALEEPVESLCPVSGSVEEIAATVDEKEPAWLKKIEAALSKVSPGKDVVIIEGIGGFEAGSDSARIEGKIVEALKTRAVLVAAYEASPDVDRIVAAAKMLADNLLGIVVNAVPENRMDTVKGKTVPALEQSGIKVLGVLPEDRALLGVTIGKLAEHVEGSILNSEDRSNELVESLMVGAMSVDSALSYLSLKANKAVITRGDRPDIQLAALETSTRCLVLTGNIDPAPGILSRAQELSVPIVLVDKDTVGTMEALEEVFEKGISLDGKKLERIDSIIGNHLDMEAFYQAV